MAVKTTNKVLKEWREEANLTLDDASVEVKRILGRGSLSRETIRRYETKCPAQQMDPLLLTALTRVYGHSPKELPSEAVQVVRRASDLLERALSCMDGAPLVAA